MLRIIFFSLIACLFHTQAQTPTFEPADGYATRYITEILSYYGTTEPVMVMVDNTLSNRCIDLKKIKTVNTEESLTVTIISKDLADALELGPSEAHDNALMHIHMHYATQQLKPSKWVRAVLILVLHTLIKQANPHLVTGMRIFLTGIMGVLTLGAYHELALPFLAYTIAAKVGHYSVLKTGLKNLAPSNYIQRWWIRHLLSSLSPQNSANDPAHIPS